MKLTSKLQRLKQQKLSKQADANAEPRGNGLSLSTWILVFLFLTLIGVGTLAGFEFLVWNKIPPELAGLWEVEDGPLKRSTFEFFRDGSMEQTLKVNAKGIKRNVAQKMHVALKDKTLMM